MYPSDIVEEEWIHLAPFVGPCKIGRPRKHNIRDIINGIRYVMRSGCQWRLLPKDFPHGKQYMTIIYVGVRMVDGKKYMID